MVPDQDRPDAPSSTTDDMPSFRPGAANWVLVIVDTPIGPLPVVTTLYLPKDVPPIDLDMAASVAIVGVFRDQQQALAIGHEHTKTWQSPWTYRPDPEEVPEQAPLPPAAAASDGTVAPTVTQFPELLPPPAGVEWATVRLDTPMGPTFAALPVVIPGGAAKLVENPMPCQLTIVEVAADHPSAWAQAVSHDQEATAARLQKLN